MKQQPAKQRASDPRTPCLLGGHPNSREGDGFPSEFLGLDPALPLAVDSALAGTGACSPSSLRIQYWATGHMGQGLEGSLQFLPTAQEVSLWRGQPAGPLVTWHKTNAQNLQQTYML